VRSVSEPMDARPKVIRLPPQLPGWTLRAR
jgi:hypothetical protein